jgi:hypothetical protein
MPRHPWNRALDKLVIVKFNHEGSFHDRVAVVTGVTWHTLTLHLLCEDGLPDGEIEIRKGQVTYLEVFNWEELERAQTKAKEEESLFPERAETSCSHCGSETHETGECFD